MEGHADTYYNKQLYNYAAVYYCIYNTSDISGRTV